MPFNNTGKQRSKGDFENGFNEYINETKKNVGKILGEDDGEPGWVNDRAWLVSDWIANKDNCRMKLTKDNCDLAILEIGNIDDHGDGWNNINWDCKSLLPITEIVSAESIRNVTWGIFKKTLYGDYFNRFAFSNRLVIEDCTTNEFFTDPENPSPTNRTGSLKIISFTWLNITQHNEDGDIGYERSQNGDMTTLAWPTDDLGNGNPFDTYDFAPGGNERLECNSNEYKAIMGKLMGKPTNLSYPDEWWTAVSSSAGQAIDEIRNYWSEGYA